MYIYIYIYIFNIIMFIYIVPNLNRLDWRTRKKIRRGGDHPDLDCIAVDAVLILVQDWQPPPPTQYAIHRILEFQRPILDLFWPIDGKRIAADWLTGSAGPTRANGRTRHWSPRLYTNRRLSQCTWPFRRTSGRPAPCPDYLLGRQRFRRAMLSLSIEFVFPTAVFPSWSWWV